MSNKIGTKMRTGAKWATVLGVVGLFAALIGVYATLQNNSAQAQTGYPTNQSIPKPTGLTASVSYSPGTVVTLNWSAPSGQVDGYQIMRRKAPGETGFSIVANNTTNTTTKYQDGSITSTGTYAYRVRTILGTESSRPSKPVTLSVEYVQPTPAPTPTHDDDVLEATRLSRDILAAEVDRVADVIADSIDGCSLYEIEHPIYDGETAYATEPEGVRCLPMRHLWVDHCVPASLYARADNEKLTISSYEEGVPAFVAHRSNTMNFLDFTFTSSGSIPRYIGPDTEPGVLGLPRVVDTWHDSPIIRYLGPGHERRFDFAVDGGSRRTYNYDTGVVFEPFTGDIAERYTIHMAKLHQRLVDITTPGAEYDLAPNCQFLETEASAYQEVSTSNKLTLGTFAWGGNDYGDDVDVFYVDVEQGFEYRAFVAGVDPSANRIINVSGRPTIGQPPNLSDIEPQLQVLDTNGAEIARGDNRSWISFIPNITGRHYVQISAPDDEERAGVYRVTVEIDGEGTGDFPADDTTMGVLQSNGSTNGSITTGDVDWFKLVIGNRAKPHTLVATGSLTAGAVAEPPGLIVYKANGNVLVDDRDAFTVDGQRVLEFVPPQNGTYYVAVLSIPHGRTGDYTLYHHSDDRPGLLPQSPIQTIMNLDLPGEGTIDGSWDRDAYYMELDNQHNYTVEIVGDPNLTDQPDFQLEFVKENTGDPDFTLTERDDGSYLLAYVQDTGVGYSGASRMPTGATEQIAIYTVVTLGDMTPADYTVSLSTDQYQVVTTTDIHPGIDANGAITGGVVRYNFNPTFDGATGTMEGALQGNGDEDIFTVTAENGYFMFDFDVQGDEDTVVGMQIWVHHGHGNIADFPIAAGELGIPTGGLSTGSYLYVKNVHPDTTLEYTLNITFHEDM